jgi:hypothetical protein
MSRIIFSCPEIIEAHNESVAAQKPPIFSIKPECRPGSNGVSYSTILCTIGKKVGPLLIRVLGEVHVGKIAPMDQLEVDKMNAESDGKYPVEKRDKTPTMNVQKYICRIETDDDGKPIGELPGDDKLSPLFRVLELIDKWFYDTIKERLDSGSIVLRDPRQKVYPAGATVVANTKIASVIQTTVSMSSKKNPGQDLANAICRLPMKFNRETGMPRKSQAFYDASKPYVDAKTGKRGFKMLMYDGAPVSAHNVHNIKTRSRFSGVLQADTCCYSNLAISNPCDLTTVIIEPPVEFEAFDLEDIIGDAFDDAFEGIGGPAIPESSQAPPGGGGKSRLGAEAPPDGQVADGQVADGQVADDELNDVMAELSMVDE